jgi:hypothetical protein
VCALLFVIILFYIHILSMSSSLFARPSVITALHLQNSDVDRDDYVDDDDDANDGDFHVVSSNVDHHHRQRHHQQDSGDTPNISPSASGDDNRTQRKSRKRKRTRSQHQQQQQQQQPPPPPINLVRAADININELMADVHRDDNEAPAGNVIAAPLQPTLVPAMLVEDERDWNFEMQARRRPRRPPGDPDGDADDDVEQGENEGDDQNDAGVCELCRVGQLFSSNTTTQNTATETLYVRALARYHEFFVLGMPDENNCKLVALEYNATCFRMDQMRNGALGLKKWSGAEVLYHFRNHTRNPYYMLQDHIQFLQRSLMQLRRNAVWNIDVADPSQRRVLDTKNMMAWTRFAKLQMDMIKQAEALRAGTLGGGTSTGPGMAAGSGNKGSNAGRPGGRGAGIRFSDPHRV